MTELYSYHHELHFGDDYNALFIPTSV